MPGGRPTKLTQPHHTTKDGRTVTIADHIINVLRTGSYLEDAANSSGVHRRTIYHWLNTGAQTETAILRGTKQPQDLTTYEAACRSFSRDVTRARGDWVASALARQEQAARGGLRSTKTVEKVEVVRDDAGNEVERVVERVTTIEESAPDPKVDQWRLEHMLPERYGRATLRVVADEEEPGDLVSVEERAASLAEALEGLLDDEDLLALTAGDEVVG